MVWQSCAGRIQKPQGHRTGRLPPNSGGGGHTVPDTSTSPGESKQPHPRMSKRKHLFCHGSRMQGMSRDFIAFRDCAPRVPAFTPLWQALPSIICAKAGEFQSCPIPILNPVFSLDNPVGLVLDPPAAHQRFRYNNCRGFIVHLTFSHKPEMPLCCPAYSLPFLLC